SQLSLGDSNAKEALTAPEEGAPYYALLSADLAKNTAAPSASDAAYLAVRIDEGARTLTFISLPPSVSVELSDGERHALRDATSVGGDAELLRAAGSLLGVQFAHFASTDAEGLASLVDLVGGVPVELSEEVDDPRAGIHVPPPVPDADGPGAHALRAANYSDAMGMQAKMRALFTVNLAERATRARAPSVIATARPPGYGLDERPAHFLGRCSAPSPRRRCTPPWFPGAHDLRRGRGDLRGVRRGSRRDDGSGERGNRRRVSRATWPMSTAARHRGGATAAASRARRPVAASF
ncbi:MAG: LCP family protein, partial [Coriobacteriaceae bacterium]